jgi:hypothetical protein
MESWWQLGEGYGFRGQEVQLHEITCPFCFERGNFKVTFHAEKKKPNESKKLNFDTLECGNCKGYVMALWSAGEHSDLYDVRVLPWPLKLDKYPKHWPDTVGRFWLQAHRNLRDENWDATAVMARSSLQAALRDKSAKGKTLRDEIVDLADQGILPPIMRDWSDNVRELGNDAAHPKPDQPATSAQDAKDVVRFLDFLLEYLYDVPHRIEQYRARKNEEDDA